LPLVRCYTGHKFIQQKGKIKHSKISFQVNYVGEGVKGLLKDGGSKRRAVVENLFKTMGGTLEAFYYAFGDTDLYIIGDAPDDATAAITLTAVSTGTANINTMVLMTPENVDQAAKKTPSYSRPGK
jgi:uncharacterized protein with GYD domain